MLAERAAPGLGAQNRRRRLGLTLRLGGERIADMGERLGLRRRTMGCQTERGPRCQQFVGSTNFRAHATLIASGLMDPHPGRKVNHGRV